MHDCVDVDVYLWCGSRPIIEDCRGVRFAPLPKGTGGGKGEGRNMWDQVDDFKWLKDSPSPNWRVMEEGERIGEEVWKEVLASGEGRGLEDILREVGLKS
jgi:hypothetical protein